MCFQTVSKGVINTFWFSEDRSIPLPDCELEENYLKSCLDSIHSTLSMKSPQRSPPHKGTAGRQAHWYYKFPLSNSGKSYSPVLTHSPGINHIPAHGSQNSRLPLHPSWDAQVSGGYRAAISSVVPGWATLLLLVWFLSDLAQQQTWAAAQPWTTPYHHLGAGGRAPAARSSSKITDLNTTDGLA